MKINRQCREQRNYKEVVRLRIISYTNLMIEIMQSARVYKIIGKVKKKSINKQKYGLESWNLYTRSREYK